LHGGHLVDGLAAAFFVTARDVEVGVVHQVAEHVDGDTGVGVPLGVRRNAGRHRG